MDLGQVLGRRAPGEAKEREERDKCKEMKN